MNLEKLSGIEIGQLVNTKEISPVEVIQYFASRIEARNPSINAFVYTKFDDALEEARKMESRLAKGEYCGELAGVPVALKDFLPSKKGWTNSHGGVKSLIMEDDSDSEFYKAAKSKGCIAIGKTNAPSFGFSGCCYNKLYGVTKNPFNTRYNSGGSSGGSASAVADGLVPIAEGGDAGGSIRIPSSWCNCFGFKSSVGRVVNYCRPDGWSATHPFCCGGAITRSVSDSFAITSEMTKYNRRDPYSVPSHLFDNVMLADKKLKIGVTYDFNMFPRNPQTIDVLNKAVKLFTDFGYVVEEVNFDFKHTLQEFTHMWCKTISIDTALDLYYWKQAGLDLVKDHRSELPEAFIYWNSEASKMGIHDMRKFNEMRTDILDNFEDVFNTYDLILSPVTVYPALLNDYIEGTNDCGIPWSYYGGQAIDSMIGFGETFLVNFIGYPAASVPMSIIDYNIPVGVQLIAPKLQDHLIYGVSKLIEINNPWSYDIAFDRI